MKKTYYLLFCVYLLLVNTVCFGQMNTTPEDDVPQMATGMRADGKIYVVIAVLVIILAGICVYLVSLDRRISRLEREQGLPRLAEKK